MRIGLLLQYIECRRECLLIMSGDVLITDKNIYRFYNGRWYNRKEL